MDKPTHLIEYETMVMGRHVHMGARSSRAIGGLERSAYILLSRLQMQGPMTITELSGAFGLDASTLNRQTAGLTREGLAERIPDADGGIARKFRITEQGVGRLEKVRAETIGFLDLMMGDWTTREVADFAAYLKRFNADIERMDGRPWPRPEE